MDHRHHSSTAADFTVLRLDPNELTADPDLLRRLRDETVRPDEAQVCGVRLRLDDPVGLFLWRVLLHAAATPPTIPPPPAGTARSGTAGGAR